MKIRSFTRPVKKPIGAAHEQPIMKRAKSRFTRHGRRASQTSVRLRNTGMIRRLVENIPAAEVDAVVLERVATRFGGSDSEAREILATLSPELAKLASKHCHPIGRPGCQECPVRMLCHSWHAKHVDASEPLDKPTIAEFFAGAGGMSLGFEQAGFRTQLAVEIDIDATQTYKANRPSMAEDQVVCGDMQEFLRTANLEQLRHVDGIVGGPPCQTFSLVGLLTKGHADPSQEILEDQRTWLPTAFARIIVEARPRFAIMENVAAFKNAVDGKIRDEVINILEQAYALAEAKVAAHKNGAPQKRHRYVLIAIRAYGNGGRAEAQNKANRIRDKLEAGTRDGVTVRQALKPLEAFPTVKAGGGSEYVRAGAKETWNHYARRHNERDLKIYGALRPGQTARELEAEKPGIIPYDTTSFADKYRKIDPDGYSPTIPAHLKKDANSFVLDGVNRGVTPRAAALLQGFPMDYVFLGSQSHQFMQIGNAVPPPVAKAVATLVREELGLN